MDGDSSPDITSDLYALVVFLHVSCTRDLFDALAVQELSFTQLQLLERLSRGGSPTVAQAASMMCVTRSAASRIVDGLKRRGLVRREPDDKDYRAKRVTVTDRGRQAIAALHAARVSEVAAFTELLEPDERDQLQGLMHRLLEREPIAAYRPALDHGAV